MIAGIVRLCAGIVLGCTIITGCSKEPLTSITPAPPAPVADTTFVMNNPVNKDVLLALVNETRAKGCNCGDTVMAPAPPVRWNVALERAAYLHSQDMVTNNYFSHNSPDGNNAGWRINRMGYQWRSWGENIALGILNERTVVEGWFKSPVHCKVLMNNKFSEMGVAKAGNFWSQEMAMPKAGI